MTFKIRFHTRFTRDKKTKRTRKLTKFTCHRRTLQSIINEALGIDNTEPRPKSKKEKRRIRLKWERNNPKKDRIVSKSKSEGIKESNSRKFY